MEHVPLRRRGRYKKNLQDCSDTGVLSKSPGASVIRVLLALGSDNPLSL